MRGDEVGAEFLRVRYAATKLTMGLTTSELWNGVVGKGGGRGSGTLSDPLRDGGEAVLSRVAKDARDVSEFAVNVRSGGLGISGTT